MSIDVPVTFNLSAEDKVRLEKFAADSNMKRSTFIRSIVLEYLKKKGR